MSIQGRPRARISKILAAALLTGGATATALTLATQLRAQTPPPAKRSSLRPSICESPRLDAGLKQLTGRKRREYKAARCGPPKILRDLRRRAEVRRPRSQTHADVLTVLTRSTYL